MTRLRDEVASARQAALAFHPLADLFPLIDGSDFGELVEDIRANGLCERIVIHEGKILDGRNRYRAAVACGRIKPDAYFGKHGTVNDGYREFGSEREDGSDPLAFVISKNLHRRHLSESQRAMVAARLATIGHGGDRSKPPIGGLSARAAAGRLNVGQRSVERARAIFAAEPGLAEAVTRGEASVAAASEIARLPAEEQRRIIEAADPKVFAAVAKNLRAQKQAQKKQHRTSREAQLAGKITALPGKRYGVIVADPEWRFEPYSRETGMDRAADNHYPTSATEIIAARDVASIAAVDCALFLWATAPMLPDALQVMQAWGFAYKSHVVWRKAERKIAATVDKGKLDRGHGSGALVFGPGYWFRFGHELLLVGTRGNIPAPAMGDQFPSVIDAPPVKFRIGGKVVHSAKPERFLEIVEAYFPNLPKIELNRRGPARKGWDAWGNEAGDEKRGRAA